MSLVCNICNIDISGNQPFTKLQCQHGAHLECYIKDCFYQGINYHCKTCNNLQISEDAYNKIIREVRAREPEDLSEIEKLFQENPEFQEDALKWKHKFKIYNASKNKFKIKVRLLKNDFNNEIKSQVEVLRLICDRYKNLAKKSDEYKNAMKKRRVYSRIENQIQQKWNIKRSELAKFFKLRTDNLFSYYRCRTELDVNYKFCVRFIH